MATSTAVRKPLGVRATPEQHRVLTEAAARQHRSLNSFVLNAALEAAVRAANPMNRDLVAELIAERRAEAASE